MRVTCVAFCKRLTKTDTTFNLLEILDELIVDTIPTVVPEGAFKLVSLWRDIEDAVSVEVEIEKPDGNRIVVDAPRLTGLEESTLMALDLSNLPLEFIGRYWFQLRAKDVLSERVALDVQRVARLVESSA